MFAIRTVCDGLMLSRGDRCGACAADPVGTDQFRARGTTLNLVKDASGRVTGADGGHRPRPEDPLQGLNQERRTQNPTIGSLTTDAGNRRRLAGSRR